MVKRTPDENPVVSNSPASRPMSFALWSLCLLMSFVFVSPEAAGQTSRDPFAVYQASLDRQLSAILQDLHDNAPDSQAQADTTQPLMVAAPIAGDAHGEFGSFAKQFWGGRDADLAIALKRLQTIRPTLESILQSQGVPGDLIGVVLIESAAQPFAQSPRQARGLWQLIPETARQYGLEVREGRDQRVEIEASTHAAARYLRDLYDRFENWPLALAAYNAGQDAVQRALKASKAATFSQLSSDRILPEETRAYVPAVLAAMRLLGSDPRFKTAPKRDAQPTYAATALSQLALSQMEVLQTSLESGAGRSAW